MKHDQLNELKIYQKRKMKKSIILLWMPLIQVTNQILVFIVFQLFYLENGLKEKNHIFMQQKNIRKNILEKLQLFVIFQEYVNI